MAAVIMPLIIRKGLIVRGLQANRWPLIKAFFNQTRVNVTR